MADFIDEVNEELRKDKINNFWRKSSGYAIGISVLLVVATIGNELWQDHKEQQQILASGAYLEAHRKLESREWEKAVTAFSAVRSKDVSGISTLSLLQEARALREMGKTEEAKQRYRQLVDDFKCEKGLRDMARIYLSLILLQERVAYAELETLLSPILKENKHPFSPFAKEQLSYSALQSGDAAMARRLMEEVIANEAAPPSARQRMKAQLASLPAYTYQDENIVK